MNPESILSTPFFKKLITAAPYPKDESNEGFIDLAKTLVRTGLRNEPSDALRHFIFSLIETQTRLLEVGSRSGVLSIDFLLNAKKAQYACMVNADQHCYRASYYNARLNNQKTSNFDSLLLDINTDAIEVNILFDCLILGTSNIEPEVFLNLIHKKLQPGSFIVFTVYEGDACSRGSEIMKCMVENSIKSHLEPFIDPIDGRMYLVCVAKT